MSRRVAITLLLLWESAVAAGCLAGVAANGWSSFLANFIRYGLGVGAGIAIVLAIAAWWDARLIGRPKDH